MGVPGSGRRPLPREIKALRGTLRPEQARIRPVSTLDGRVTPPSGTPRPVVKVFRQIVRLLEPSKLLKPADVPLLTMLAMAVWTNREAMAGLVENGLTQPDPSHANKLSKSPLFQIWRDSAQQIVTLSARFGLSPSDRERLAGAGDSNQEPNEYEIFKARRQMARSARGEGNGDAPE